MLRERAAADDSVLHKELAGARRELETLKSRFEIAKSILEKKDERIQGLEARVAEAEPRAQTSRGGEGEASPPEVDDARAVAHGKGLAPANSVRQAEVAERRLEHAKGRRRATDDAATRMRLCR